MFDEEGSYRDDIYWDHIMRRHLPGALTATFAGHRPGQEANVFRGRVPLENALLQRAAVSHDPAIRARVAIYAQIQTRRTLAVEHVTPEVP